MEKYCESLYPVPDNAVTAEDGKPEEVEATPSRQEVKRAYQVVDSSLGGPIGLKANYSSSDVTE